MSDVKARLVEALQNCWDIQNENIDYILDECMERCVEDHFGPELEPTWENVIEQCTWKDISYYFESALMHHFSEIDELKSLIENIEHVLFPPQPPTLIERVTKISDCLSCLTSMLSSTQSMIDETDEDIEAVKQEVEYIYKTVVGELESEAYAVKEALEVD